MTARPRLLVVDDDPHIISALNRLLTYEGYDVVVAYDGLAALDRVRERLPDLIVLDLMLPGIDGIEVCRRIREEIGDVAILMLTARDAIADRVQGLDTGADDYLVKPFANEELLSRVRAVLRRKPPGANRRLTFADIELDVEAHEARRGQRHIELTPKEFDLLEHFLRHPRQVLRREQLIEAVWGYDAQAASNVVDVYVGYLREKLEISGAARVIHTVRGVGFVLRDQPPGQ